MKLKVDYRETKFHHIANAVVENLEVGDFVFEDDDGRPVLVIERKTVLDLLSSVNDGRYHEQKARLLALPCKVCYLLENYHAWSSLPKDTCRTIIVNLQLVHGFGVLTSRNDHESVDIIKHICSKMTENPEKYTAAQQPLSYASCVKIKKSDNLDVKTCTVMQLCTIRRVSAKVAECILDATDSKCMADLVKKAGLLGRDAFVQLISSSKPNGAVKKIGDKMAIDVYTMLFGN
eukprot:gene19626-26310_t